MRAWKGTKREREKRARSRAKLRAKYGVATDHEATILFLKDLKKAIDKTKLG